MTEPYIDVRPLARAIENLRARGASHSQIEMVMATIDMVGVEAMISAFTEADALATESGMAVAEVVRIARERRRIRESAGWTATVVN